MRIFSQGQQLMEKEHVHRNLSLLKMHSHLVNTDYNIRIKDNNKPISVSIRFVLRLLLFNFHEKEFELGKLRK